MVLVNLLGIDMVRKRKIDPSWRTDKNRVIAKKFDWEFFDGDRSNGYGGYYYDGRWKSIVKKLQEVYKIDTESSVLDIGCAKGFLLYDLQDMIPGIKVAGIDISKYALNHAMEGFGEYISQKTGEDPKKLEDAARKKILPFMIEGSADNLPWPDNSFDVVLSMNTTHNLPIKECARSIKEMIRVCRTNNMFIQVDSYRNKEEKKAMDYWNLTGLTVLHTDNWLNLFKRVEYKGDYFWTIIQPED